MVMTLLIVAIAVIWLVARAFGKMAKESGYRTGYTQERQDDEQAAALRDWSDRQSK